ISTFKDTATTEIYTLSLHDALPIFREPGTAQKTDKSVWASLRARLSGEQRDRIDEVLSTIGLDDERRRPAGLLSHGQKQFLEIRSEEHTSELQSRENLVCRLLLEKK